MSEREYRQRTISLAAAGADRCESRRPCNATLCRLVRWKSCCKHGKSSAWSRRIDCRVALRLAELLRSVSYTPRIRRTRSKHLSVQCCLQSCVNALSLSLLAFLRARRCRQNGPLLCFSSRARSSLFELHPVEGSELGSLLLSMSSANDLASLRIASTSSFLFIHREISNAF